MIHSMSGGVIKDAGSHTFVKVLFDGEDTPFWYVTDLFVEQGDMVKAPRGRENAPAIGTVVRVEQNVSGQVTPIPLRSAKRIISVERKNVQEHDD